MEEKEEEEEEEGIRCVIGVAFVTGLVSRLAVGLAPHPEPG